MRSLSTPLLALVSLLTACSDPPTMVGTVKDPWGQPLAGATVQIEDVVEQATTDASGAFSFQRVTGKRRIQAGKDGYIRTVEAWGLPDELESELTSIDLRVFPDPPQSGFFLINDTAYSELAAQSVDLAGTEIKAYTGIKTGGEVKIRSKDRLRFIFSSPRSRAELAHLDLQLHRLEFIENVPVSTVLGEEQVKINRFIAAGEPVPFELKELDSGDDYLLTTRASLEPGHYAFHTEGQLTTTRSDGLDKLPEELRKAWPLLVTE